METELPTVAVVGQAEMGRRASPERTRAVSISLVLLEQLEVLQEQDSLTNHVHPNLFQVALLEMEFLGLHNSYLCVSLTLSQCQVVMTCE